MIGWLRAIVAGAAAKDFAVLSDGLANAVTLVQSEPMAVSEAYWRRKLGRCPRQQSLFGR